MCIAKPSAVDPSIAPRSRRAPAPRRRCRAPEPAALRGSGSRCSPASRSASGDRRVGNRPTSPAQVPQRSGPASRRDRRISGRRSRSSCAHRHHDSEPTLDRPDRVSALPSPVLGAHLSNCRASLLVAVVAVAACGSSSPASPAERQRRRVPQRSRVRPGRRPPSTVRWPRRAARRPARHADREADGANADGFWTARGTGALAVGPAPSRHVGRRHARTALRAEGVRHGRRRDLASVCVSRRRVHDQGPSHRRRFPANGPAGPARPDGLPQERPAGLRVELAAADRHEDQGADRRRRPRAAGSGPTWRPRRPRAER